jgi:hypothetical protein
MPALRERIDKRFPLTEFVEKRITGCMAILMALLYAVNRRTGKRIGT